MLNKFNPQNTIDNKEIRLAKKHIIAYLLRIIKKSDYGIANPTSIDENSPIEYAMSDPITASITMAGLLQYNSIISIDGIFDSTAFKSVSTIKEFADFLIDGNHII